MIGSDYRANVLPFAYGCMQLAQLSGIECQLSRLKICIPRYRSDENFVK